MQVYIIMEKNIVIRNKLLHILSKDFSQGCWQYPKIKDNLVKNVALKAGFQNTT